MQLSTLVPKPSVVLVLGAGSLSNRTLLYSKLSSRPLIYNVCSWITPSIFQAQDGSIVDEWTLCEKAVNPKEILEQHWSSWVTLGDFQKIAGTGINTVRIPIGYWAFQKYDGDPYIQGAQDYLDQAIGWARQTGLKVWVDLHGAPGSQNGYDNSGHRIATPGWTTGDTVSATEDVLKMIADKYAQPSYQDVVVAIELINEPLMSELSGGQDAVRQYYRDGYDIVRGVSDTPVMLHDGFVAPSAWNDFLTPSDNNAQKGEYSSLKDRFRYPRLRLTLCLIIVVIDHHEYQVFDDTQVAYPPWEHRQQVCNNAATYTANRNHWLVVGEWSAAQTDCAPALNGYLIGARYDGTYPGSAFVGSCDGINYIDQWNQTFKDDTRGYIEAQLEVFERETQGWVFWNFKTEMAPEWDFFKLIDAGVFPQPLSDRKFSAICSF